MKDTLTGKRVIYKPFPNCPPELIVEGIVVGSNDEYLFVRYGEDIHAKATNQKDVDFI